MANTSESPNILGRLINNDKSGSFPRSDDIVNHNLPYRGIFACLFVYLLKSAATNTDDFCKERTRIIY